MNGKQRIQAVLSGQQTDRVQVMASSLAHAAWLRGVPQREFHTNANTLAGTVVAVSRTLGTDGIYVSSDNWIMPPVSRKRPGRALS